MHEYTANLSANTLQARSTSGRHQRCCCRQCWSKIRCRRCAARKLALRGRPAQERNVEHRAWQDDPASLCARRRLVGCPKNRQEKLIGSRRTARQRHESSSGVVHGVRLKTPVGRQTRENVHLDLPKAKQCDINPQKATGLGLGSAASSQSVM